MDPKECNATRNSGGALTDLEWEAVLRHCEKDARRRLVQLGFSQEVLEEALLKTVLKLVQGQGGQAIRRDSLWALLWQMAYHCAIDEVRKKRPERPLEVTDENGRVNEFPSRASDPERQAIVKTDLGRCLHALAAEERAIVLHKHYGLSAREIATLMGIASADSVNTRYSQACKMLRECLGSTGANRSRGIRGGARERSE